jgi:hypothetical protein
LKIPKRYSEDVIPEGQAIQLPREKVKNTNNELQNITQRTKDFEQHEPQRECTQVLQTG